MAVNKNKRYAGAGRGFTGHSKRVENEDTHGRLPDYPVDQPVTHPGRHVALPKMEGYGPPPMVLGDAVNPDRKSETMEGNLADPPGTKKRKNFKPVKRPGALTKKAETAGMGVQEFARTHKHAPGLTGQQARFALTAKHWKHGSKRGK